MTPPEARDERLEAGAPEAPPAVSVCAEPAAAPLPATVPPRAIRHGVLAVIAERKDFLKAASARRQGSASFLLQARDRRDGHALTRIGFTASKKVGNAVIRARAKRRLRALARDLLAELGKPGWDYVLVARPEGTVTRLYAEMQADLRAAFASVHQARSVHQDRAPRPRRETPGREGQQT